jgi:uncharacterized protein (DUF1800 family)
MRPTRLLLRWAGAGAALLLALALASCGGSKSAGDAASSGAATSLGDQPPPPPATPPSFKDASRFLTQATFGIQSEQQVQDLVNAGYERWLWDQFQKSANSHVAYLDAQKSRNDNGRPSEEMSYEAIWQQWLNEDGQLRARVAWALLQITVISNIAPDLRPYAMSSYMDMLNKNAFGNYRQLLEDVTLHPAMGYYLNMLQSEKENAAKGTHPNENYAREILQLFSIGLVQLNPDGTKKLDGNGKPIPTYDENVIKGFAKAFSGWSFGTGNTSDDNAFDNVDEEQNAVWLTPMKAWPTRHDTGAKLLLDGKVLPAGGTAEADMKAALDTIFNHPNVPPFVSYRLIQRLVTSNPSPAYVRRVADVFANNGQGVRGDLKAVVRAILLDPEARDAGKTADAQFGKQREPVIRFANFLRAFNAKSKSGANRIDYLDSPDEGLGQSPLLSPTVFNFYTPFYAPAGPVTQAGLVAPEFQITTEITTAGQLNFFWRFINQEGYGWGDDEVKMDFTPYEAVAKDTDQLIAKIDKVFFNSAMTDSTRAIMRQAVDAVDKNDKNWRVKVALTLTALAPDYVIQK